MSGITFRSDISVTLGEHCGSDSYTARAAWVIPPGAEESRDSPLGRERVIASCTRGRHNTPFEHGLMSVYVEAPGVVWWQLTRQRFMSLDTEDFSFNLESGRYKHLDPEFYLPPPERPCLEPTGFKPMRPHFMADADVHSLLVDNVRLSAIAAWEAYGTMLDRGVAREVARLCLPNWALYCDGYVSAKPLTWLQFFSKRAKTADTAVPTFPQYEIEQFARQCEAEFARLFPITYAAFCESGRVAP